VNQWPSMYYSFTQVGRSHHLVISDVPLQELWPHLSCNSKVSLFTRSHVGLKSFGLDYKIVKDNMNGAYLYVRPPSFPSWLPPNATCKTKFTLQLPDAESWKHKHEIYI